MIVAINAGLLVYMAVFVVKTVIHKARRKIEEEVAYVEWEGGYAPYPGPQYPYYGQQPYGGQPQYPYPYPYGAPQYAPQYPPGAGGAPSQAAWPAAKWVQGHAHTRAHASVGLGEEGCICGLACMGGVPPAKMLASWTTCLRALAAGPAPQQLLNFAPPTTLCSGANAAANGSSAVPPVASSKPPAGPSSSRPASPRGSMGTAGVAGGSDDKPPGGNPSRLSRASTEKADVVDAAAGGAAAGAGGAGGRSAAGPLGGVGGAGAAAAGGLTTGLQVKAPSPSGLQGAGSSSLRASSPRLAAKLDAAPPAAGPAAGAGSGAGAPAAKEGSGEQVLPFSADSY